LEFKEAKNREKFGHFGLWLSLVERLVRDDSQMIFSLDPDLI